ncbi:hypothetical protein EW146_g2053 [Bondarzewia mesenterica]|uniref:Uncharacterized protein n=1 Tax=Bondarzewia mesenterica TaxID=1095465 RepID=A0A4S4M1V1_9AGAM|nr:hypothetical protein EW146_g2053 [Bondarzewia mesenterica]
MTRLDRLPNRKRARTPGRAGNSQARLCKARIQLRKDIRVTNEQQSTTIIDANSLGKYDLPLPSLSLLFSVQVALKTTSHSLADPAQETFHDHERNQIHIVEPAIVLTFFRAVLRLYTVHHDQGGRKRRDSNAFDNILETLTYLLILGPTAATGRQNGSDEPARVGL